MTTPILFTGKSKNWSASYVVTDLNDEYHNETLTITYKGDNPSEVGIVKYKYTGGLMEGSGERELSGHKEIVAKVGSNGACTQEDSIINVTIEWNGIKEEIRLSGNEKR
jgi:hypothetical protein